MPREIWALIASNFCVALGYGVVAPIIPQLVTSFGVTFAAASMITSIFSLVRLISSPGAGWLSRIIGERTLFLLGLLIVAVSTGLCAIANDFWTLLAMRGVGGIGSVMATIATTSLVIKLSPELSRGKVASYMGSSFLLGNLCGPVVGSLVLSWGFRAPFVFYAVLLVVAALTVYIALHKSDVGKRRTPGSPKTAAITLPQALQQHSYWTLLVSFFTLGWSSWGVRVATVPLFVTAMVSEDNAAPGWVLFGYAAGNALLIIPSGRWNDIIGRKPLIILGSICGGIAFIALPYSGTLWATITIMAVAGAGSALTNPGLQAAQADIVGKRSGGQVVATTQMTTDIGGVVGPLLAGLIVDASGFHLAFIVTGALLLFAAGSWLFVPDTKPRC